MLGYVSSAPRITPSFQQTSNSTPQAKKQRQCPDCGPRVVIPHDELSGVTHRPYCPHLLPPGPPLIQRPHVPQDHLYLSLPLPRSPTNAHP